MLGRVGRLERAAGGARWRRRAHAVHRDARRRSRPQITLSPPRFLPRLRVEAAGRRGPLVGAHRGDRLVADAAARNRRRAPGRAGPSTARSARPRRLRTRRRVAWLLSTSANGRRPLSAYATTQSATRRTSAPRHEGAGSRRGRRRPRRRRAGRRAGRPDRGRGSRAELRRSAGREPRRDRRPAGHRSDGEKLKRRRMRPRPVATDRAAARSPNRRRHALRPRLRERRRSPPTRLGRDRCGAGRGRRSPSVAPQARNPRSQ